MKSLIQYTFIVLLIIILLAAMLLFQRPTGGAVTDVFSPGNDVMIYAAITLLIAIVGFFFIFRDKAL